MTPIAEQFETRVLRILKNAGMETLEEIATRPAWEWLRVPGCGRKTIRDMEDVLRQHGLSLEGGEYHPRDGYVGAKWRFIAGEIDRKKSHRVRELEDALWFISHINNTRDRYSSDIDMIIVEVLKETPCPTT